MKYADPHSARVAAKRLRLYLMRHGETERSSEARLYGHTDAPLSPAGIEQSRRLATELSARPLAAVYSSDLSRAVLAAQLIADTQGLIPWIVPELREANMGEWEARPLSEIARAQPEMVSCLFTDPSGFRYPGGESFAEFQARIERALRKVLEAHTEGEIAIVTHGGVSRLMLGSMLELSPRNLLCLSQDFGCMNVIDVFDGQPLVRIVNSVPGAGGLPP